MTLTLGAIAPTRLGSPWGLFNLMQHLGEAIGIAGCGTVLNDRTNLHFLRMTEHLNTANTVMMQMLGLADANATAPNRGNPTMGHALVWRLWTLTMREAEAQTCSDASPALMLYLGIATGMVPLMRKVMSPRAPLTDGCGAEARMVALWDLLEA